MANDNIALTIDKSIVTPIVEAKIKELVISALGGGDNIIEGAVKTILNTRVDEHGKINSNSYNNKYNWLDYVLTNQVNKLIKEAITEEIKKNSNVIKDALIAQLQTKKGSNHVAKVMLDAFNKSLQTYYTSIEITFREAKSY